MNFRVVTSPYLIHSKQGGQGGCGALQGTAQQHPHHICHISIILGLATVCLQAGVRQALCGGQRNSYLWALLGLRFSTAAAAVAGNGTDLVRSQACLQLAQHICRHLPLLQGGESVL